MQNQSLLVITFWVFVKLVILTLRSKKDKNILQKIIVLSGFAIYSGILIYIVYTIMYPTIEYILNFSSEHLLSQKRYIQNLSLMLSIIVDAFNSFYLEKRISISLTTGHPVEKYLLSTILFTVISFVFMILTVFLFSILPFIIT